MAGEKTAIAKASYTHEAMVDLIVAKPQITQGELAHHFGYTPGWISQVVNSDAFQEALARRKNELVDPRLRMSIEEKLKGLVDQSLIILAEKLAATQDAKMAMKALDVGARAAGYGIKSANIGQVNNYIAVVPPKERSGADWANKYGPAIDVKPNE